MNKYSVEMGVNILFAMVQIKEKLEPALYRQYYDALIDYTPSHTLFMDTCASSYSFYGHIPSPQELITSLDIAIARHADDEAKKTKNDHKEFYDRIYDKIFNRLVKIKDKILATEDESFLKYHWIIRYNILLSYLGAYTVETWTTGSGMNLKYHSRTELPEPSIVMGAWKAVLNV